MNAFTITIEAPALATALAQLAQALAGVHTNQQPVQMPVVQQAPTMQQPLPLVQQAPVAPPPVQQAVPVQQAPPVVPQQTAVPTSAPPTYTVTQLQQACAPLVDAGKQPQIVALIQSFGVQALTQLPPERLGEFATALRGLGAQI